MHIPKTKNLLLCPVNALKQIITQLNIKPNHPLFMIKTSSGKTILTAPQVRGVFASASSFWV